MSLSLAQLSTLDLVRGFVAVGRRMSITQAADDLCLTQSAVSRQVQGLERSLGVKLLVRGYRSVSLTPEGEQLFRIADAAIQQLQDVLGAVKQDGRSRPVTVTSSIGVTTLWLLPRLSKLQRLHPGLDVRVAASNRVTELRHDDIDLAIRYTSAQHAPNGARHLFGESIAPVAHPSLLETPWRGLASLRKMTLLEFEAPKHPWLQWSHWLHARGWPAARGAGMLHFNQYDTTLQAALAGQGVALGRLELIESLLKTGQLVLVDSHAVQTSHAYWLVQAEESPRREVARVAAWIGAEADLASEMTPNESA